MCPQLSGNWNSDSARAWGSVFTILCVWKDSGLGFAALSFTSFLENTGIQFYLGSSFGDLAWMISWWLELEAERKWWRKLGALRWVAGIHKASMPRPWSHPTPGCGSGHKSWSHIQHHSPPTIENLSKKFKNYRPAALSACLFLSVLIFRKLR